MEYGVAGMTYDTDSAGTHSHTMGTHSHDVTGTTGSTTPPSTGASSSDTVTLGGETHGHTITAVNAAHSGVSAAGTAHTILSPIIAVNYIIKV